MPTLLARGFRPFFLLACLSGVVFLTVWVGNLSGTGRVDVFWHGHELVFGFMGAVLGGFFLTAAPKWTKQRALVGWPLAGMVVLWFAGRVAMLMELPWLARLLLVLAFPAALTAIISFYVLRTWSQRNLLFPVLLAVWTGLNAAHHLAQAGVAFEGLPALRLAVYALLGVIVIFGGRVIPLFTKNAYKGVFEVRQRMLIDDVAIGSVLILIPIQIVPSMHTAMAPLMVGAAILNLLRMIGWGTLHTLRNPIVWVIHVAYGFVAVGLMVEAAAVVWPARIPRSTALHTLTIGVLGLFAIGMMSRVTRGHTGQPLIVPRTLSVAYIAIVVAMIVRVAVPVVSPPHAPVAWLIAGSLWVISFAALVAVDGPALVRPRVDGRPG